MKVQVTIELSDNARLGVGLQETGLLVPASRKEAASWITELVNDELGDVERTVVKGIESMKQTEQSINTALHGG